MDAPLRRISLRARSTTADWRAGILALCHIRAQNATMLHDSEDDFGPDAKFADCWTTIYSRRVFNGSEKDAIWRKFKGRCAYCHAKVGHKFHFDHIHPWARGGASVVANGALTCLPCHYAKKWTDRNRPFDASVLFFRKVHRSVDRHEQLYLAYQSSRIDWSQIHVLGNGQSHKVNARRSRART